MSHDHTVQFSLAAWHTARVFVSAQLPCKGNSPFQARKGATVPPVRLWAGSCGPCPRRGSFGAFSGLLLPHALCPNFQRGLCRGFFSSGISPSHLLPGARVLSFGSSSPCRGYVQSSFCIHVSTVRVQMLCSPRVCQRGVSLAEARGGAVAFFQRCSSQAAIQA